MRFSLGLPVCFFFLFFLGWEVRSACVGDLQKKIGSTTTKKKILVQQQQKKKIGSTTTKKKNGSTKKILGSKKTFDTQDSRVVPHRSTDWAQWCLTSQFGWDAVYPPWFDRMMGSWFL